jgi:hypothetical protein
MNSSPGTNEIATLFEWPTLLSAICSLDLTKMPKPRKNNLLRFLSPNRSSSKHRQQSLAEEEEASVTERAKNVQTTTMPIFDISTNFSEDQTEFAPEHDDDSEVHVLEPVGSNYSSQSIQAKQTTATLAETFSSGGVNEFAESRDDGEAHGEYYGNPEDLEYNDSQAYSEPAVYTEFNNETQDDDADTLDYTATGREREEDGYYYEETVHSGDAMHDRRDDQHEAHWEETSMGYETCASRTLNTNLEGMQYVPGSVMQEPSVMESVMEPQCYEGQYEEGSQFYEEEGYVYEESGQYYDATGQLVEDYTVAESTVATDARQSIGSSITKEAAYRAAIHEEEDSDDDSEPIESYQSEDSEDSWGDEETRDMSLLDSRSQNQSQGGTFDDEDDSSGDDEDDEDDEHRSRRRRRPATMLDLLKTMKNCNLKGATQSDDEGDFEFLPDVAQTSTGATSRTSMTAGESYDTRENRSPSRRKRRSKKDRTLNTLFNKVSALGEELLGTNNESTPKGGKGGKKSRRQRDQDPTTRIIDSLRDIFSCGTPRHY